MPLDCDCDFPLQIHTFKVIELQMRRRHAVTDKNQLTFELAARRQMMRNEITAYSKILSCVVSSKTKLIVGPELAPEHFEVLEVAAVARRRHAILPEGLCDVVRSLVQFRHPIAATIEVA